MVRDIQFGVAARVRASSVRGDATPWMSPVDASHLMAGLQGLNADANDVHNLDRYAGTGDEHGQIRYALDEALPRGADLAVDIEGIKTPISLDWLNS